MQRSHPPLDFLPDRSVPIRTPKTQFLTYIVAVIHWRASFVPSYRAIIPHWDVEYKRMTISLLNQQAPRRSSPKESLRRACNSSARLKAAVSLQVFL